MSTSDETSNRKTVAGNLLHMNCIMCGSDNPFGIKLNFQYPEEGHVEAEVTVPAHFQGYDGLVHGGIIASLLDSAMTHCLLKEGIAAVTGDMNIRYKRPVPIGRKLLLKARKVAQRKQLFTMDSELRMNDETMAKASARFVNSPAALDNT